MCVTATNSVRWVFIFSLFEAAAQKRVKVSHRYFMHKVKQYCQTMWHKLLNYLNFSWQQKICFCVLKYQRTTDIVIFLWKKARLSVCGSVWTLQSLCRYHVGQTEDGRQVWTADNSLIRRLQTNESEPMWKKYKEDEGQELFNRHKMTAAHGGKMLPWQTMKNTALC